jgi:hypothetical protein
MAIFLLMYFIVYGGMNAYALSKARAAFEMGPKGFTMLFAFGVLMVMGPILVRFMERFGLDAIARPLEIGFMFWFGFVFIFASNALLADTYRLISHITKGLLPTLAPLHLFYGVFVVSISVFTYGVVEARGLTVVRETVTHPGMPVGQVIRVVQITDLHLGATQGQARLDKVISAIMKENPDIIVSTGDMVDGLMHNSKELAIDLKNLTPPLGKYAVMGNHEYYAGMGYALSFHKSAGFNMLRDQSAIPAPGLYIAGADYYGRQGRQMSVDAKSKTAGEMLSGALPDDFVLLLKHVPVITDATSGKFHLQLSGHTHNGQIFPFNLLVKVAFPYITGTYQLPEGGLLHVSRGTGSWGPPVRVLSPPELTVIDIKGSKATAVASAVKN